MNILILGGFLGSGKTSVLLRLARRLSETPGVGTKLAIIENEIGAVSIDGLAMSQGGFEVKNIFSGCVCCTLSVSLIEGILEIREALRPEWVIIEPTGIALPSSIAKTIMEYVKPDKLRISVLADAERWDVLSRAISPLVEGQFELADTALVNKTDLVDAETIARVTDEIHKLNDNIQIFPICAASEIGDDVWAAILGDEL